MNRTLRGILLGGTIAAVLDILAAFAFYAARGIPPAAILQSIASGLLGRDAYAGGAATAALGAALHGFIAIAAAFVFYGASRAWPWLARHPVAAGTGFGLGMYATMNAVVLPLSAFPHEVSFAPAVLAFSLFAHCVLVGQPIAFLARAAR